MLSPPVPVPTCSDRLSQYWHRRRALVWRRCRDRRRERTLWAQGAWETGLRAPHREPGTPLADSAEVPPPSGSHPTSPGADQPRIARPCHFWSGTLGERSELLPVPSRSGLFETALTRDLLDGNLSGCQRRTFHRTTLSSTSLGSRLRRVR